MQTLWQDLRYGARMLAKKPGFTLTIVITLALGIGANTAIFSMLNALLLKPVSGVTAPERLAQLGRTEKGRNFGSLSYADYRDYVAQSTLLDGIAVTDRKSFHISTAKTAAAISGALVSGNYFEVLGVEPLEGRLLAPGDSEVEGAQPVAVISARLWQRLFDSDPAVVGRAVTLNAHSFTIIGITAADFRGTEVLGEKPDVWVPVTMWRQCDPWMASIQVDWLNSRTSNWLEAFARLKDGVTLEQAQAELSVIAQRLEQAFPESNKDVGVRLVAGLGLSPADSSEVETFMLVLMGVVGIVLLIACANVAGLLLARASTRQKEIGIRLALGASRARIVRQLLTESTVLAVLGGTLGVLIAVWLNEWLNVLLPEDVTGFKLGLEFGLDGRVLAFTLALSLFTGLLFGLAPALKASRADLIPVLKNAGQVSVGTRRSRLRNVLVVAQIALSLVLLVAAGLLARTLYNARSVDVGFDYHDVLTASVNVGRQNYDEQRGRIFYQQLLERAQGWPGVESATLARSVPLAGGISGNDILPEGKPRKNVTYNVVTPGYFAQMGIPLLIGRDFSDGDNSAAPRVAIVNEKLAQLVWPSENPLGKHFRWAGEKEQTLIEVIGVARDIKNSDILDPTRSQLYLPLAQKYQSEMTLQLRTSIPPTELSAVVQQEIRAMDANLPVERVRTLDHVLNNSLGPYRMQAVLVSACGLLALVLASVGLYGVLSYGVSQRTREIGIRVALGARRRDVLWLVIGQGMKLVLVGLAVGLPGALAVTSVLKSMLFGVDATDPLTFVVIALLLTFVALLSCWIPARRATKVDPMVALRYE